MKTPPRGGTRVKTIQLSHFEYAASFQTGPHKDSFVVLKWIDVIRLKNRTCRLAESSDILPTSCLVRSCNVGLIVISVCLFLLQFDCEPSYNLSEEMLIITGKPVKRINSSKFCLGRLLDIRNKVREIILESKVIDLPSLNR